MVQTLVLQRFQSKPGDALAELLRKYADRQRFRTNKRQAQIARDAWLDESYVSRLISGERANPSRDALILLGAFGLELPVHELDEISRIVAMSFCEPRSW